MKHPRRNNWKKHTNLPCPDDGQEVPEGYMRCGIWNHQGPRIMPRTSEYFRIHRDVNHYKDNLQPVCLECHNRAFREYRIRTAPFRKWKQARSSLSGKVGVILRGVAFAFPTHLPIGKLACSRCFEVKIFNKKNFDTKNYKVEPVCLTCKKKIA